MKEILRECLKNVSAASIQEANDVVNYLAEMLEKGNDGPQLSREAMSAFIAGMLIEYGKLKAKENKT